MRVKGGGVALLTIVVLALVGGVSWILWSPESATVSAIPDRASSGTRSDASTDRSRDPAEGGASTDAASPVRADSHEAQRDESEELVGVQLQLLDAVTKQPRDDAAVWFIDPDPNLAKTRNELWNQSDPLVDRLGRKLDVDREGRVTLPAESPLEVVARATDRFARKSVRRSEGAKQVLVLEPDAPLRVRVVDASGAVVGDVPVVLDLVPLDGDPKSSVANRAMRSFQSMSVEERVRRGIASDASRVFWSGVTARDTGEAEVPHGAKLLLDQSEPDRVARRVALRFRLGLPTRKGDAKLVDPRLDVHEPVTLVVPALAKLRIAIEDETGAPIHAGFRVATFLAPSADPAANGPGRLRTGSGASAEGSPLEMVVPVREKVELLVEPDDTTFAARFVTADATERADECTDVAVRLGKNTAKRASAAIGRAIGPDGGILANVAMSVESPGEFMGVRNTGTTTHSDEHGVFSLPAASMSIWILTAPLANGRKGRDPPLLATTSWISSANGADVDLGDVRFTEQPRLLAGRVVDGAGHGIPDATVHVYWKQENFPRGPARSIETDRAGFFELRGKAEDTRLFVNAEAQDWFTPGTTIDEQDRLVIPKGAFDTGATGVSLVLHRCGTVRGEFLLDSGVEPTDLILEPWPRPLIRAEVGPENRFRLVGPPGSWALTVKARGGSILTEIPDIKFLEDTVTDDHRLQPVDLTGVVRMPVQVVGPDGVAIPGADLVVLPPVGQRIPTRRFVADPFGRESIIAKRGDGPLLVATSGRHFESVPIEPIAKKVVLREGLRVNVTVALPRETPATIAARLVAVFEEPLQSGRREAAVFGEIRPPAPLAPLKDGVFETVLCGPGRYRIGIVLHAADRPVDLVLSPETSRIDVLDVDGPQRFEVRVDDEQIRSALEQASR